MVELPAEGNPANPPAIFGHADTAHRGPFNIFAELKMFNREKNSLALKENPIFAEIGFTVTVPVTCETKAAPPPGRRGGWRMGRAMAASEIRIVVWARPRPRGEPG